MAPAAAVLKGSAMGTAQSIYIIGIGGTGVGALAGLLKQAGHTVWGSDTALYPPMSDRLAAWGIPVHEGYDQAHLQPHPDQVIIGNVIREANPEVQRVEEGFGRNVSHSWKMK